jgi:predicted small lipoprotein YifL
MMIRLLALCSILFSLTACARDSDLPDSLREAKELLDGHAVALGEAEQAIKQAGDAEAVRAAVDLFQASRKTYLAGVGRLGPAFPDMDSADGKKIAVSFSNVAVAQERFFTSLNAARLKFNPLGN